jgi:hypothetical protein
VAASYLNRGKMVCGAGVPVALLPAIVLMGVNGRPLIATLPAWTVPIWRRLGALALHARPDRALRRRLPRLATSASVPAGVSMPAVGRL